MFNSAKMYEVRSRLLNRFRNRHCDIVVATSLNNNNEVIMWSPKSLQVREGSQVISEYQGKVFVSEVTQVHPASSLSKDLTPFNIVKGVVALEGYEAYEQEYNRIGDKLNAIIDEERNKQDEIEERELFGSLGADLLHFYEPDEK